MSQIRTLGTAQRAALTRDWRLYGFGRLYWRKAHPNWRDWDSDDVAMAIDSPVRMHFKSSAAIRDVIEEFKSPASAGLAAATAAKDDSTRPPMEQEPNDE